MIIILTKAKPLFHRGAEVPVVKTKVSSIY